MFSHVYEVSEEAKPVRVLECPDLLVRHKAIRKNYIGVGGGASAAIGAELEKLESTSASFKLLVGSGVAH